jgi:hypothetical protein
MKNIKSRLLTWLLRLLAVSCWGVRLQNDLPPEFILSNHARRRIEERDFTSGAYEPMNITVRAWYEGKRLPSSKGQATFVDQMPLGFNFFEYRLYSGFVYVYGVRWHSKLGFAQKTLVTAYHFIPRVWNI